AVLEVAVPVEIHDADLGPGGNLNRAALERRIKLRRVEIDHLRAEVIGEERVVDGIAAHLEALDVDVAARVEARLPGRPQAEADAAVDPAEEIHAHALLVDLVQELGAAVLARRRTVDGGSRHRVALGHYRRVERASRVHHVDHSASHRARLLHHANRFRTAAYLDGELALAGVVGLLDEFEEAA